MMAVNASTISVPGAAQAAAPQAAPPVDAIRQPHGRKQSRLEPKDFPHPPPGTSNAPPTTLENLAYLIDQYGLTVRFDVIKKRVRIIREDGQPASDSDIASLANLNRLNGQWLQQFIFEIAKRNSYNPVAEWIAAKAWDGTDRLPAFYRTLTETDDYPEGLKEALLYRWMLSIAAAATLDRRFHCRGVLTLQGEQGLGKTSWVASLLPAGQMRNEFIKRDHHLDASSKDSILGAISHLITEIGELDSSFRKDVARLKGFLTNDCDKLRPPYARCEVEMDRRTVFAATVNDENFLIDTTGNTRFWTVSIQRADYQHTIDMQQLFAQLREELEGGAQWWLTPAEEEQLANYNLRHRSVSAVEERISDLVDHELIGTDSGRYMTAIEVLKAAGLTNPSNRQCKECGTTLRGLLGAPKRVKGRDRWRVPLLEASGVQTLNYPTPAYEDRF